jgi:hypothetical protein
LERSAYGVEAVIGSWAFAFRLLPSTSFGILEIIDERYLSEATKREVKHVEALKHARGVVRHVGVRGGFKYLSYEYTDDAGVICHLSTSSKAEAEKLAGLVEEHKIPVKQVVVK